MGSHHSQTTKLAGPIPRPKRTEIESLAHEEIDKLTVEIGPWGPLAFTAGAVVIVVLLLRTRRLREELWRWTYLSRYVWLIAAGILLLGVGREAIHDARDFQFHNCWLAEGNPVVEVKLAEREVEKYRTYKERAGADWSHGSQSELEHRIRELDDARREFSEARLADEETTL